MFAVTTNRSSSGGAKIYGSDRGEHDRGGALPNADTDPSLVGKQFGGTNATPSDLDAITVAHVKKVLSAVPRELARMAKPFASDPVAAICEPALRPLFVSTLETTVRGLVR